MTATPAALASRESSRQIRWIGLALAATWTAAFIMALLVPRPLIGPVTLGAQDGNPFVQLATYSFIHWNLTYLVVDLVWLAGIVHLAQQRTNAEGFVRFYSVGTIGGGALWLAIAWLISRIQGDATSPEFGLGGSAIALVTMIGALAAIPGDEQAYFLGPDVARGVQEKLGTVLIGIAVLYVLSDWAANRVLNPETTWSLTGFLSDLTSSSVLWRLLDLGDIAATLFVVTNRIEVSRIAPTLIAPFLLVSLGLAIVEGNPGLFGSPFLYAYATGLVLGKAYGAAERFFAAQSSAA